MRAMKLDDAIIARFRTSQRLLDHGRRELRADALAIAAAALAAVDPAAALRRLIRIEGDDLVVRGAPWVGLRPPHGAPPIAEDGRAARPAAASASAEAGHRPSDTVVPLAGRRVFLVGAGKASLGMAVVLDELLGPRFTDAAVVVKRGQLEGLPRPLRHIDVREASHPLPDESSMAGGLRLLEVARQARPGDLLIGIVTGGSSALAVAPAGGISLDDKIETNRLLLTCGADIVSINNVRKHLSAIKGGLLAAACGPGCQIVNFTVSDVVGDPLDYVTDLTVPDRSTWAMARDTCDRFRLWNLLPPAVATRLRDAGAAAETPKDVPGTTVGEALTWVVADAAQMCAAAAEEARRYGYAPRLLGLDWEGEARDAGCAVARELLASPPGTCLLAGGENTVTMAPGLHGFGGPSQEAALAAALELAGPESARTASPRPTDGGAAVLCLDSDGTDGPTDAAGGLVDDLTASLAAVSGCGGSSDRRAAGAAGGGDVYRPPADAAIAAALEAHTASDCLAALGDLVVTGPTDTNVNDLKIALRGR
jgi:hydroxypyruvate reductase/glycerate 2-kinase